MDQVIKREFEDENCDMETDFDFQNTNAKKIKTKVQASTINLKTSIQLLYELKQIHPIKFELISSEGPSHKRCFKYKLSATISNEPKDFNADGNSVKNSKKIAALKCLYYLTTKTTEIPACNVGYIRAVIDNDFKTLNVDKPIDEWLITTTNIPETSNSPKNFLLFLDQKSREVLATKNTLSILNHFLQTIDYEFVDCESTTSMNTKQFKIELKIKKNEYLAAKRLSFGTCTDEALNCQRTSTFMCETLDELKFQGVANNKKSAKIRAAQIALENIFNIKVEENDSNIESLDESFDPINSNVNTKEFANSISEMIREKYYKLVETLESDIKKNAELIVDEDLELTCQGKLRTVYAGVVQSSCLDLSTAKIVCVTSGTKCVSGEFMSQNGNVINDCHAEILAVRMLRKYLYEQINQLSSPEWSSSIFELPDKNTTHLKLKKNIQFNLFISSAPCGDGRIFSRADNISEDNLETVDNHPNRKIRGVLRAKIECGEGTVPCNNLSSYQTWDGILAGERLKVMSCSDKLCKFNVVGVQGALLSHFVESIYFSSVIIGAYYHRNHLSRALYRRIDGKIHDLPRGYRLNKPLLSSVTNNLIRQVSKSSNKAITWSQLNDNIEVIVSKTGQTIKGTRSFACKAELFKSWVNTLNNLRRTFGQSKLEALIKPGFIKYKEIGYNEVKMEAVEYQTAKLKLYEAFQDAKNGLWITKPFEQNFFTIASTITK